MIQCRKLLELPLVVSEWQQIVWFPDCEHYALGKCAMPGSAGAEHVCPQDGKALSLHLVTSNECDLQERENEMRYVSPDIERWIDATEQAIREKILLRTCGRIQALDVEVAESVVTVHGHVSCFHLKQLALQGVLDVVSASRNFGIELYIDVDNAASPSEAETVEDVRDAWKIVAEGENNDESVVTTSTPI